MTADPLRANFEAVFKTLLLGAPALGADDPALGAKPGATLGIEQWASTLAVDAAFVEASPLDTSQTLLASTIAQPSLASADGYAADAGVTPVTLPALSLARDGSGEAGSSVSPGADLVPLRTLGEGGMGVVTLARQRSLARDVALKRVRPDARSAHSAQALLVEATMTGALEHPNIVPVHLLGRDDGGEPVMVMKRVEGVAWSALLDDPRHPAWASALGDGESDDEAKPDDAGREGEATDRLVANLGVLAHVCNALHFAHSRGVVHRDLKPENVMIGSFGEVYLLDWGIALRTGSLTEAQRSSVVLTGTPCFMAPELVTGKLDAVGPHTDVYLLGATLHAVLTGRPRHEGRTVHEVLLNAYESAPFDYGPEVPAELAALCNAATSRDGAARPASARAFRRAITTYLRHRGSLEVARRAGAKLAEFERAEPGVFARDAASLARPETWQALTEARLAYTQALRAWAGNESARAGLRKCLDLLVERELALENSAAAGALLDELEGEGEGDTQALRERLAGVREKSARERTQVAFAEREAFERDVSVSSRARAMLFVGFTVVMCLSGVPNVLRELRTGQGTTRAEQFGLDVTMLVLLGLPVLFARKKLLANRVSRSLLLSTLLSFGLATLTDALAVKLGADGRAMGVYATMVIAGTLLGALLQLVPRAWPAPVVLIAGAVLIALVPQWSTLVSLCSVIVCTAVLVQTGGRDRGDAPVPPLPTTSSSPRA